MPFNQQCHSSDYTIVTTGIYSCHAPDGGLTGINSKRRSVIEQ